MKQFLKVQAQALSGAVVATANVLVLTGAWDASTETVAGLGLVTTAWMLVLRQMYSVTDE